MTWWIGRQGAPLKGDAPSPALHAPGAIRPFVVLARPCIPAKARSLLLGLALALAHMLRLLLPVIPTLLAPLLIPTLLLRPILLLVPNKAWLLRRSPHRSTGHTVMMSAVACHLVRAVLAAGMPGCFR